MALTLVFLPSPLLGPSVWRPVAEAVEDRGLHSVIASVPAGVQTSEDVLDAFLEASPADRDLAVVPHSNAGAFVPALVERRAVVATVFVDAILPPPHGSVPLAPPSFLAILRTKAEADGLLPPWTSWWAEEVVAELFPDAATRSAVEREQQQLPLSYFEMAMPAPRGWDQRSGAYLALGDTYTDERDDAVRRGWPTNTLRGGHLHQLHDPESVADTIVALLGQAIREH
ncbi:hypothetical protein [Citricoccus sp.]|uniref:hypothetical protein n=1 Tax=Citricoccus sp. TaxID=1978372 RepID=UPI0028BEA3A7|nr:hypothetical protein [Citricoccus sp.]